MWGRNVRATVAKGTWDALRWSFGVTKEKPLFMEIKVPSPDRANPLKCRICGVQDNSLELHEQWKFDDRRLIQHLIGLMPVCQDCHQAMHLGRADLLGLGKKARQHLAKTNKWSAKQTTKHVQEAFTKWKRRSQHQYSLDLSWLHQWIPESKVHLAWLDRPMQWIGDRLDSIRWARKMLESDAVIVDTETTGLLDYSRVEVIEIGVVTMRGKVLYNSRFRPRYQIPKHTTDIHGITDADVRNEPPFRDEHPNLMNVLHSRLAIAYNAKFDNGVITRTCRRYKLDPPDCRWECAMHAYRVFLGSGRYMRLPWGTHSAVADCKAVLKLLRHMAKG